jgi:putative ABC transport system ATP-binding protein
MRDVSLEIGSGEYVAITGPSGSGKSTLLYLASGLDYPDAGTAYFDGQAPRTAAQWARLRATRIGFVFQSFHLIASLSAVENVEIPMLGVVAGEKARKERALSLLKRVGLGERTAHRVADLSGGEAQRVAIARALANGPEVLLADEPTGNLDTETAAQILNLLEELREREHVSLVIVTHDEKIAARATRVVRLRDGRIEAEQRRGESA